MKPIHFSKALGACALAAFAAAAVAPANAGVHAVPNKRVTAGARLVEFAVPGAAPRVTPHCYLPCGTQALAVSPSGAITGTYTDAYNVLRGFLRTANGAILKFDGTSVRPPVAGDMTAGYSINASGEIAGQFRKDGVSHGLLRAPNGQIQIFDVPTSSVADGQSTIAQSINASGIVAGNFLDGSGLTRGFVRMPDGAIATFKAPGSVSTEVCAGACVDAQGKVTGSYTNVWGSHCYIRAAGNGAARPFTTFDAPGAGFGPNEGTTCSAINAEGTVVGTVVEIGGLSHGFVRSAAGNITVFDVTVNGAMLQPGTHATSIDDRGVITGYYTDAHQVSHAYSRSPNGTFRILEAPGAGTSAGEGTFAAMNDSAGGIAGSFVDADGVSRGFWWVP